jgi:hypothetical protein
MLLSFLLILDSEAVDHDRAAPCISCINGLISIRVQIVRPQIISSQLEKALSSSNVTG